MNKLTIGTRVSWIDPDDGKTTRYGTIIEWTYENMKSDISYLVRVDDGRYIKLPKSKLL